MNTFLTEVRETLVPGRSGPFEPLPPFLVAMTVVTGLVGRVQLSGLGPRVRGQHDR